MGDWKSDTKTPTFQNTKYPGVRYRLHPTRKHGVQRDRYFTIRFYVDGKRVEEGVGWASEGWTAKISAELRSELQNNAKTGRGERTLAEKRETAERKREAQRREKEAQEKSDISFQTFFYETFLPDARLRWKPETTAAAEQHVKNWIGPVMGKIPMREIGIMDVNRLKNTLAESGKSPRMLQYVFRTFSMVWNSSLDYGVVTTVCPVKNQSFRLPKVDNERQRYLSSDEEGKLFEIVLSKNKQAYDMAIVSIDAGLRFGEIAGLTWGCVDLHRSTLKIVNTKGGKDRDVPMTKRLNELFESMTVGLSSELVFPLLSTGRRHKQIPSSFKRALVESGLNNGVTDPKLKVSFHSLRHTFASRLVQAGIDLYRVQRLLGHSTPVMTQRYSKLADDDLRLAVEAMETKRVDKQTEGRVIAFRKKA